MMNTKNYMSIFYDSIGKKVIKHLKDNKIVFMKPKNNS